MSYLGSRMSNGANSYPCTLDAKGLRLAVVVARFNHLVSARLLEGCLEEVEALGGDLGGVDIAWVPGAYEIPNAARVLAASGRYQAIVTLGAVIRGGTPHFDFVCHGVTDGVREVVRDTGVPVAFGVLTTDDIDQALARCGGDHGNKGQEVARAAIEMACLSSGLQRAPEISL